MSDNTSKRCDTSKSCTDCRAGGANGLARVDTKLLIPFQKASERKRLQRHEVLLKASSEQPWGQVYCVNSGLLKLVRRDAEGNDTILKLYSSGGLIGLPSVVARDGAPNASDGSELLIEALVESDLCLIPSREVEQLLLKDPGFCRSVLSAFASEILDDQARIAALAVKPVRARIAGLLLEMATGYGEASESTVRLGNILSRQEIASLAGTAIETAVRAIQSLRKDNLVALNGREIVILDLDGLREAAA